jgi:hypothetical protein
MTSPPAGAAGEACFRAEAADVPTPQFFDKCPRGTKPTPAHQDGGFSMPRVTNGAPLPRPPCAMRGAASAQALRNITSNSQGWPRVRKFAQGV